MTDRNKFEEMLERLVNEDRAGAEELFHEIVVERSREIYETLLAEDEEEVEETTDEEVDEAEDKEDDEDDKMDEATDEEVDESEDEDDLDEAFFDEMGPEEDPEADMMGDIEMPAGDDMGADMGADMDMGMGDEGGDLEDRVMDIEDELEALKAEFEAMLGGSDDEGDEDDEDEMPMDVDSEEGDDEEDEDDDDDDDDNGMPFKAESSVKKSQAELMREYADKVAPAKMGDNGANTKSTVAGANNMGGTAGNIAQAHTVNDPEVGAGKKIAGSALNDQNPKDMNTKNVNVPGAKAATKMTAQPGHGAEKKGKPETADKSATSTLNKLSSRAK